MRSGVRMGQFFCEYPVVLTGIFLAPVKDHILKQSVLAGAVTGKLSGFTGFAFVALICSPFALDLYRSLYGLLRLSSRGCSGVYDSSAEG
jgi:hypothetical protein